jgi:acyl carrier protein
MTRSQFLGSYEKLWEMPAATLKPEMRLDGLSDWDSIAVLNTIALMDREFGVKVTGDQIAACQTLGDILDLAGADLSD